MRWWGPFGDVRGHLSFTKLVIVAVLVGLLCRVPLPTVLTVALVAASFGKSTFEKWLTRAQFTATATETTARRIADEGYQETP